MGLLGSNARARGDSFGVSEIRREALLVLMLLGMNLSALKTMGILDGVGTFRHLLDLHLLDWDPRPTS